MQGAISVATSEDGRLRAGHLSLLVGAANTQWVVDRLHSCSRPPDPILERAIQIEVKRSVPAAQNARTQTKWTLF
jgi:hypothetical protein